MPEQPDATGPIVAGVTVTWLRRSAAAIHERRAWLTELDAAIGDGDHGINLDRGFAAVVEVLDGQEAPGLGTSALLQMAGRRLLAVVGGASGALYGKGLLSAADRLAARATEPRLDSRRTARVALEGVVEGITALGRAAPGDKTMLDALLPAVAVLGAAPADLPLATVMHEMAQAGEAGAEATIPLVARKGRASYLGPRSAGHLDPGAASCAILLRCLAEAVIGDAR